jgi:hypothetical protein
VAIYTGAKALSRWPINDESTLTLSAPASIMGPKTSTQGLASNPEFQATTLAAYDIRRIAYEQGIEAVEDAAISNLDTEAGRNLEFLGNAMRETAFDRSKRPTGWDEHGTLPEFVPENAKDTEMVALAQMKFVELLFEEAGKMSMRQMMTFLNFINSFVGETMLSDYEEAGCGSVGDWEKEEDKWQDDEEEEEEGNLEGDVEDGDGRYEDGPEEVGHFGGRFGDQLVDDELEMDDA